MILIDRYALVFFSLLIFCNLSYAQNGGTDTVAMPKPGDYAQVNELFFDALKSKLHEDNKQEKELLEKFVAKQPDEAIGYYELSKIYRGEKNITKAENYIKKSVELNPKNKWYKKENASILEEKGDFEGAAKITAVLSEEEPTDEEFPLLTAEYYEKAKKYNQAIKYLNVALSRNGFDIEILMRKVQIFLELNEPEEAAKVIVELLTKDSRNGKFYKALGEIYDNNNDTNKSSALYDKALKIIPNDPTLQLGLAEHYLKLGDTSLYTSYLKKAIVNKEFEPEFQIKLLEAYMQNLPNDSVAKTEGMPIIKDLVEQHPNDADMLAFYGDFLENDNQQEAASETYKKSLEINASRFNVWVRLLQNYSGRRNADSLIKYSEKVIRLFPNQALGSYYNGIGYLNKKEFPKAIKSVNRAIDIQPENKPEILAAMYATLGDLYYFTKQFELSDNAYDKSVKLNANDATVLNNYSYYLSERGKNLDIAENLSKKSLQLRPGETTFLDTYAWILYKKGDFKTALEYLKKAVSTNPEKVDGTIYDHLGNTYYQLKNTEKAIENWKLAKLKGCDDSFLDKKINEGKLYE